MPARDKVHKALVNALIKDGWTITADPYFVKVGRRKGFVDLAADKYLIPNNRHILTRLFLCQTRRKKLA